MRDDLLQPSLGTSRAPAPLYSIRAAFFVSFFGGPLAAIAFSALNSVRLRRLAKDLPVYAGALAVLGLGIGWLAAADGAASARAALGERGTWGLVHRGVGLLLCGAFYLLHRPFYRSAGLLGIDAPSPWVPGLACVLVGGALFGLVRALALGELPR